MGMGIAAIGAGDGMAGAVTIAPQLRHLPCCPA
jgi:hypothetical protein